MYKGKKRNLIAVCLVVCFALLSNIIALASEAKPEVLEKDGIISPRMTYFAYLATGIDIDSSGLATAYAYCDVDAGSTSSISIYTELQQKQSNGSWKTIKSWSETSYGDYCELYEEYYVTGGQYRNKSTYTAYGAYGTETIEQYSNTYTY